MIKVTNYLLSIIIIIIIILAFNGKEPEVAQPV